LSINGGAMNIFRELRIFLNGVSVPDCIARLEQHASGGWQRDPQFEARLRPHPGGGRYFCFGLTENPDYSPLSLWLWEAAPDRLEVTNIISERKLELSRAEYNALLEDFHRHVAAPAADGSGGRIRLELSSETVRLEEVVPPAVVDKLRRFSASANKSSAAGHPNDLMRWVDFLTEAHRHGDGLSPRLLRLWLVEEENWPADAASQLVSEYEFAHELLATYDRKRN
jgi:hypothetical protein